MSRLHLLDRITGEAWPSLANAEDVAELEAVPLQSRLAALSTFEALKLGAAHEPGAAAIRMLQAGDAGAEEVVVTHAQFIARVTQVANMFGTLGVGAGDVVSFMLPLLPQSFFTLFGAEAAGIANPVNPLLEPGQIAEILRAAGTRVLVTLGPAPGSDTWEKAMQVRASLPGLKAIVAVHGPDDPANGIHDFDRLADAEPADRLVNGRRIEAGDTAAFFHTGGTTGTPKLVRHSHLNQVYQAWVIGLMLRSRPGRNLLFGLPLFHVGGALTQGLAQLASGGCVVVVSPKGWREAAAVANVWRLVQRYRPETLGAVPTVLAAALHVPRADADIACLQRVSGGGSAIPVAVARAYAEQFRLPVLEVYGMTETSSVHTISYPDREVRLGAVGHAVPYSRVRVVRIAADGTFAGECDVNEIGVVAMAGPGVFSGYVNDMHNKGAFVEPGWVNSGDLGRLDAEGYLWITGRAKDLIIRGGHNIDPMAIEEVLFQHPAVALAAVVGQPDAYAGELPMAFVQLKAGATVAADALIDFVRERTPERAAVPVDLVFVDTIPLTAVGKVFKPALRLEAIRRVAARMLAGVGDPGALEIEVLADPARGSVIRVRIAGVETGMLVALEADVHKRLDPLVLPHEVVRG